MIRLTGDVTGFSSAIEIIADMSTARLSPAAMAAAVGLSLDDFIGWRRSLAAARAEEERYAQPEPIPEPGSGSV